MKLIEIQDNFYQMFTSTYVFQQLGQAQLRKQEHMHTSLKVHYHDVIMDAMALQITSLTFVYSTVYSRHRSKKHQSSALLAFVQGIHRWPMNSQHKEPVTRKTFPFDDVIMSPALFEGSQPLTGGFRLSLVNSPVTDEFPAQRASNAENVSIWWRYHVTCPFWGESTADWWIPTVTRKALPCHDVNMKIPFSCASHHQRSSSAGDQR